MMRAVARVIGANERPAAAIAGADRLTVGDLTAVAGLRCVPTLADGWEHLAALAALLDAYCLGDPARTVLQARLSLVPAVGSVPAVSAALLVGVTRATPAAAIEAAEALAHDLPRLLDRRAGFRFVPLATGEALRQTLAPFEVVDGAELGVREEPVGRISSKRRARPAWHPLPPRAWSPLLAALDRLGQPVTIGVNLRATRLSLAESDYLAELEKLESLRRVRALVGAGPRWAGEEAASQPVAHDPALTALYPAPLLESSIWVGAGGSLSDLAYGGIVAALVGEAAGNWRWRRAARPRELARLRAALTAFATDSLLETDGDEDGARLARLFFTETAAGLLPLPTGDAADRASRGLRRQYPCRYRLDAADVPAPAAFATTTAAMVIGEALAGDCRVAVGREWADLLRHTYVIGQTGTGKSSLLGRMAWQDMDAGRAVVVVDPAGDLVEDLLCRIPAARHDDVIVVDPTDERRPLGLNILDAADPAAFRRSVSEFISTLYKVYDPHRLGMVGPRLENTFRCSLLAAQAAGGEATLLEVYRLLVDRDYERWLASRVTDPYLRRYFDELRMTSDFHRSETVGYFASKLGRFAADPQLRAVLCQPCAGWSLAEAIDHAKIVLVTLRQGQLGPETSGFIGGIVLTKLMLAAFARDAQPIARRAPLAVYLDEFQVYAADDAIARILAGIRKYNVAVTLANQHVHQLDEGVRTAIFGNVGTIISLRVGAADAPLLIQALQPGEVTADELVGLPNFTARVSVLEQGERLPVFDLATLPLPETTDTALAERLRQCSADRYGRDREEVDRETARRLVP